MQVFLHQDNNAEQINENLAAKSITVTCCTSLHLLVIYSLIKVPHSLILCWH